MDWNDFWKRLPFYVVTGAITALLVWLAIFHIGIFLCLPFAVTLLVLLFAVIKAIGDVLYDSYEDRKRRGNR